MLILLANVHYAKEQTWGHKFKAAMAAIRKEYNYDHVHDAASTKFILKDCRSGRAPQHETSTSAQRQQSKCSAEVQVYIGRRK
jgi:hypothetical protein